MTKLLLYSISTFFIISCSSINKVNSSSKINTMLNEKYKNSRSSFYGKLNASEYIEMINELSKELKVKLSRSKAVLINYNQNAPNCILKRFDKNTVSGVTDNKIRISSRICENNNTVDFFVYSDNVFNKKLYQTKNNFKLDSGFFYNNIFVIHENCAAFFILKPDGNFMKYYGEDYYSEVSKFLEKK